MIVDQAIEELGGWNDAAIDYWSEISGVDIRSIDENTPFDIEVANRLLATFPEVLQKFKKPAQEPKAEEVVEGISEVAEELVKELEATEEEPEVVQVSEEVEVREAAEEGEPEVEEVLEEVAEMAEALASAMGEGLGVEEAAEEEEEEEVEELVEEEVAPEVVEELAEAAKVMETIELPAVDLEPFKSLPGLVGVCAFHGERMVAKEALGEVELEVLSDLVPKALGIFRGLLGKGERKFDILVLTLGNMHVLAMPKGEFYFVAVMKAERLGAAMAFFREALKRVEA